MVSVSLLWSKLLVASVYHNGSQCFSFAARGHLRLLGKCSFVGQSGIWLLSIAVLLPLWHALLFGRRQGLQTHDREVQKLLSQVWGGGGAWGFVPLQTTI